MSKTKKNLLFMLCFALIMLVAAAFSAFNANKAHAADATADDFKVASIGIRLQDNAAETGVRFGVQINEELLNKADAKVTLYMLPQMFYVSGAHLNAGAATAQSVEIPGTGWAGENGYKTAYAYVYDFPANNYGVKLLAEACLTYTENGATVSKWTAVSDAYSLTDVAKIAQAGDKPGADGYIIDQVKITYKNADGTIIGSETLDYGATLNYPAATVIKNKTQRGWITSKNTLWNTSWTAQGNMTLTAAYYNNVSTKADLLAAIKEGTGYYILTNDIDLGYDASVGITGGDFTGVLDGNGYSINNVLVTANAKGTGLIYNLASGGVIKNTAFKGVKTGGVGWLIAKVSGTLENVYVEMSVFGSNSVGTYGWMWGGSTYVISGITSSATFTNVVIDMSATQSSLVADAPANGAIIRIENYDFKYPTVNNFMIKGILSGWSGNVIGEQAKGAQPKETIRVVSNGAKAGIYATYSDDSNNGVVFPTGWDESCWNERKDSVVWDGTKIRAKRISTKAELLAAIKEGTEYYILANDIDMGYDNTVGITTGEFSGILDGNGYSINNVLVTANAKGTGLIYNLASGGVIKNTAFKGVKTGGVGWLIAKVSGTLENVYVEMSVFGSNSVGTYGWMWGGSTYVISGITSSATFTNVVIDMSATQSSLVADAPANGAIIRIENYDFKYPTVNNFMIKGVLSGWSGNVIGEQDRSSNRVVSNGAKAGIYATYSDGTNNNVAFSQNGWSDKYWTTTSTSAMWKGATGTQTTLAKAGVTEYKIAVPDKSANEDNYGAAMRAAGELKTFFKKATGADLGNEIQDTGNLKSDVKYISIGFTNMLNNNVEGVDYDALGISGYSIKTVDGNVYISGQSAGLMNGVYEFLRTHFNYEYYTDGFYKIDDCTEKEVVLQTINEEYKPSFEYRLPAYGFEISATGGYATDDMISYRMQYNNFSIKGFGNDMWHNFFTAIPKSEYLAAHPEWFSPAGTQLCLTRDKNGLAAEMAKKVINVLNANPSATFVMIGQQDNNDWCDCSACQSVISQYGGYNSATYILFMNAVSDKLQSYTTEKGRTDVKLGMFAYHQTQDAPVTVADGKVSLINGMKLNPNVCVVYAPIDANYYVSFNDEVNASVKKNVEGWSMAADNVLYWTYMENFGYYQLIFDNFGSMQDNLKLLHEHNGMFLYNLGQYNNGNSTGFSRYKAYLNSKLMWNVNADVAAFTKDFFDNYFGVASSKMRKVFNEYRAMTKYIYEKQDKTIGYLSINGHVPKSTDFWYSYLTNWIEDINQALAEADKLAGTDDEERVRVRNAVTLESLSIRYALITYFSGNFGKDELLTMKRAWKTDAANLGVTMCGEHKTLETLYNEWRI